MNENELLERLIDDTDEKEEEIKSNNNTAKNKSNGKVEVGKVLKPVIYNSSRGKIINEKVIAYHLYNCFNYSLFVNNNTVKGKNIKYMLGVTSANPGEGKTTTACNLAAALSLSSQRKTLIIDLNTQQPQLHKIFGVPLSPGFTDALMGDEICVTPTKIENLSVLTSGNLINLPPNRLINFNLIAYSLFQEFEFLIVDMSSVDEKNFPTLIANQLNGLIVVVESSKTKRRDISRLFRRVNEKNVIGFVMNKVKDEDF